MNGSPKKETFVKLGDFIKPSDRKIMGAPAIHPRKMANDFGMSSKRPIKTTGGK